MDFSKKHLIKQLAKKLLPQKFFSNIQKAHRKLRYLFLYSQFSNKIRYFGIAHYCPICRSYLSKLLPFGVNPRPNALCPVCGSLERHRLIFLFMSKKTDVFLPPIKSMLHIAPEKCMENIFKKSEYINYITADLAPYALLQMDLTNISIQDEIFDIIYISHVFEHIVDDRKAMQEVFRVLKKNGWAILQVPINSEITFEDPSITNPKEREHFFGQSDHVRIYGLDYYNRLSEVGFTIRRQRLILQENPNIVKKLVISADEDIVLCTKK